MKFKKVYSAILFGAQLLIGAFAYAVDDISTFTIGPVGQIVYADGTTVSDGECFELIFTADGYEFAGFTTDGHLVDPAHSAVVTFGTISEIRSGVVNNMGTRDAVKDEYLDPLNCSDGVFELYLLDSRVGSGFAPISEDWEDPNVTWLPTTINAWAKATGSNSLKYSELTFNKNPGVNSGSITTSQKTVIGSTMTVPDPVIVSMAYTNGVATVGATNTVSTAKYILKGSLDLTFENTVWSSASQSGAADALTPLVFTDNDATNSAAFYRIEVVK